jgi:LysR family transcriptional regulator, carnitine catabolism transcriptional activator
MNITSRQLKAFLLTARYQSFSRAADQLFITQSGMSVLVRELEEQLGFRLFERTTRKVMLTKFGSSFLPVADRSLVELEQAAANIGRSASVEKGVLSIGATPFVAADILAPALAAYALRDAGLHVRLVDADGPRLLEMLQSGEIDVALTAMHHDTPGVRRVPLARFWLVAIAARNGAHGVSADVRWSELAHERLIAFPPGNPIRELMDEHLGRAGRRAPPDVVCNYLETQIAMVEAGSGVAVVPSFVMHACAKRAIALHALVAPQVAGNVYWLVNRARKLPTGTESFNAFLKDYMSALPAEPAPQTAQAA